MDGQTGSSVAVVHLVRRCNGVEPLQQFLNSYDQHPAGVDHDLILIFKGFESAIDPMYEKMLEGRQFSSIYVSDVGFDLVPYIRAASEFPHDYFCFLNSFSVILDKNWLARLYESILKPDVGIAGASGSWDTVFAFHSVARRAERKDLLARRGKSLIRGLVQQIPILARALWQWVFLGPFPSPHIRTNGFIVRRDRFLSACRGVNLVTKNDAYRLEHGRRSLTRRIAKAGLRTLVVGRDGREYEPQNWDTSNTFWQGDQGNLLIGDNQTRRYDHGSEAERAILAHSAWYRLKSPFPAGNSKDGQTRRVGGKIETQG